MPTRNHEITKPTFARRTNGKAVGALAVNKQNRPTSIDPRRSQRTLGPQDGDVVVAREAQFPACFTLRQTPEVVQLVTATREYALQVARAFAQEHGLDVWYSEEGLVP
jgi:hypothetical protein